MRTLRVGNSIVGSSYRRAVPVVALVLACLALSPGPNAFGVSPPPDGGYGGFNTAEGEDALFSFVGGRENTAIGYHALYQATSVDYNTAVGASALWRLTMGAFNTGIGRGTLLMANNCGNNTAVGEQALGSNTTGSDNIALGAYAGQALTTGSYNIDIGSGGVAAESKAIRIGTQGTQTATYVAGIYGATSGLGIPVYINPSGKLGTTTSSARFKRDIHSMDNTSETILALRPVTFRYKPEFDSTGIPQFGLVAEEVEKINPALVVRDADGKPYTVRYEAVNAMLLNEFLKEHKKIEEQQATIAELRSTITHQQTSFESKLAEQEKQIEALASGLQKVSARLEVSKAHSQIASCPARIAN
jgi:uncharacterized coiled-coil protein SlyX